MRWKMMLGMAMAMAMKRRNWNGNEWKPYIAMIALQFGYAGMNIITKVSLNRGMSHYVLVVYRHAIATAVIAPFAYFLELRKFSPKLTFWIFCQIFALGLLGPVIDQNLYYAGLKLTSPTLACAIDNVLPAMTFIMAAFIKMERISIVEIRSQVKIVGTVVCVGGAMVMTLYKGPPILNFHPHDRPSGLSQSSSTREWIEESLAVSIGIERDPSVWALRWDINLVTVLYSGVVASGIAYYVQGLCMHLKGPVFVTAFSPLTMIIVAIMGSLILSENIYLGSVVGGVVIVAGLYAVLWGKVQLKDADADVDVDVDASNQILQSIHREERATEHTVKVESDSC